jgi:hypothetical protein
VSSSSREASSPSVAHNRYSRNRHPKRLTQCDPCGELCLHDGETVHYPGMMQLSLPIMEGWPTIQESSSQPSESETVLRDFRSDQRATSFGRGSLETVAGRQNVRNLFRVFIS